MCFNILLINQCFRVKSLALPLVLRPRRKLLFHYFVYYKSMFQSEKSCAAMEAAILQFCLTDISSKSRLGVIINQTDSITFMQPHRASSSYSLHTLLILSSVISGAQGINCVIFQYNLLHVHYQISAGYLQLIQ